jgi:hypothetical protein
MLADVKMDESVSMQSSRLVAYLQWMLHLDIDMDAANIFIFTHGSLSFRLVVNGI